jgi:leucyl-tRNA synthetase
MRTFLNLLNPFAPHLTSELWTQLGGTGDITEQPWPGYNAKFLVEDEVEMPIQVDGKVRDRITLPLDASRDEIEKAVRGSEKVQRLVGAALATAKVIIVPNKLINVVKPKDK